MILLDTNVLLRMTDLDDPQFPVAHRAMRSLLASSEQIAIVPQNLFEFWAAATRKPGPPPDGQNGLGMTTNLASVWLQFFLRRFELFHDKEDLIGLWHTLVRSLGITGVRSHDMRLVAAMQSHGIASLLTFNARHFQNCPITVIDPRLL
jgi:predicted nucleic acid-binding protein